MPQSKKDVAVQIAVLIDRDPVMAAQIKQHVSEERLIECLDLTSVRPASRKKPRQSGQRKLPMNGAR